MSSADPGLPSLAADRPFNFGGYAEQDGTIAGVGFWPRAGARLIDIIVHYVIALFTGMFIGIALVAANHGHADPVLFAKLRHTGFTGFAFALLGSVAYHIVCVTLHGSTLGKMLLSMVVVQEDGSSCRLKGAVIREFAYFIDAFFFGIIGYLEMQKSSREQRHGDNWAHTVVSKRSRVQQNQLRGPGLFVLAFLFAVMFDSAMLTLGTVVAQSS
jgi:uncharacterized RDD family membrane protein YckC